MMDLGTIRHFQREAAKAAAWAKRQPFIAWPNETFEHLMSGGGIPNFGDYRPRGWKLIGTHFVDKSRWGLNDEPALTLYRFIQNLVPGHGYAMIEEGQFQCYVGEFVKTSRRAK